VNVVRHDGIRVEVVVSQMLLPISNGFDRHGRNFRPTKV
jgi:hypothetical protein